MIKLLLGGSPCTHWSIAQKNNRETEPIGEGWELFRNYLIALEKYQPDYFLYENNKSVARPIKNMIGKKLGVPLQHINSALVSAQNRERFYAHNIPGVPQPFDRGILLRDVLETGICWRDKGYALKAQYARGVPDDDMLKRRQNNQVAEPICVAYRGRYSDTGNRSKKTAGKIDQYYDARTDGRSNAVTTVSKDTMLAEPVGVNGEGKAYPLTTKCQFAIPDDTLSKKRHSMAAEPAMFQNPHGKNNGGVKYNKAPTVTANGRYEQNNFAVEKLPAGAAWRGRGESSAYEVRTDKKSNAVISQHQSRLVVEWWDGKSYPVYEVADGIITIKDKSYPIKLPNGLYIIRKLTVTECKRLQTVPDDYIMPCSNTQSYKMLGNGWTVDVIAHILSHIPNIQREPVEVLSMYDGMSCGHIALDKVGAAVVRYYATEIDKYAIQTTMANYPDTIQLGDAYLARSDEWTLAFGHERVLEYA